MLVNLKVLLSDPLEQFETYSFFCKSFGNLQFYFQFIFIFIFFIFYVGRFGHLRLNHKKTNLAIFNEKLFSFIFNLIGENLHVRTYLFTPVYFYIFLFILISNLIGMVPYTFTVTSSAAITLFISMSFFLGITIIGAVVQRCTLFSIFLPNGVPFLISLFLVVIELISYIARVFSLAIRLFANMMSGHGLLKILAAFV
jgi:ATP synthase subunit 6